MDPLMSGHLLWRDTFSMYGLFYHVNVPQMRGHLVTADRIFWFSVPAKAESNNYFRNILWWQTWEHLTRLISALHSSMLVAPMRGHLPSRDTCLDTEVSVEGRYYCI